MKNNTDPNYRVVEFNLKLPIKIEFPLPDKRTLVQGPLTYNADGFATKHNCDFLKEPKFQKSYELGINEIRNTLPPDHCIRWRAFVACWAANHAQNFQGDFVECGVQTGVLSRTIMNYIDFQSMSDRKFFLLDTYCGIPLEQLTEAEKDIHKGNINELNKGYFENYEQIKKKFSEFSNVVIIRGKVPFTLKEVKSERICYLSIDMNIMVPEIAAGEYFWDKLVHGAPVLLDDYGWPGHIQQKLAWDNFADKHGVKVLPLPTGQGLLIKP